MTSKKSEVPKDIGLVMGTEDERNWTQVRDGAKAAVKQAEFTITLQTAVMNLANEKILAEKLKFKQLGRKQK